MGMVRRSPLPASRGGNWGTEAQRVSHCQRLPRSPLEYARVWLLLSLTIREEAEMMSPIPDLVQGVAEFPAELPVCP